MPNRDGTGPTSSEREALERRIRELEARMAEKEGE